MMSYRYYHTAQRYNLIRLMVLLFVVMLSVVQAIMGNGLIHNDADDNDSLISVFAILVLMVLAHFALPNMYLRHKGYSAHHIRRVGIWCDLIWQSRSWLMFVWWSLVAVVYLMMNRYDLTFRLPEWQQPIWADECYRMLFVSVFPCWGLNVWSVFSVLRRKQRKSPAVV